MRPTIDALPHAARRPAIRVGVAVLVVVVVVALAVLAVLQGLSVRHHDQLEARRGAAIRAASGEVAALLTVSASSSSTDLKRLLAGATADFRDQLTKDATAFQQALKQGRVTSTGSVVGAGLVSLQGRSAVVAIAARQTIRNVSSPKGSPRNYRLTVTVNEVDGAWLASKLNFVVGTGS